MLPCIASSFWYADCSFMFCGFVSLFVVFFIGEARVVLQRKEDETFGVMTWRFRLARFLLFMTIGFAWLCDLSVRGLRTSVARDILVAWRHCNNFEFCLEHEKYWVMSTTPSHGKIKCCARLLRDFSGWHWSNVNVLVGGREDFNLNFRFQGRHLLKIVGKRVRTT